MVGAYGQRDIVKHDVEARCASREIVPHEPGNVLSLRDQLAGVELGDHALKYFVDDGGKDSLVVVGAESAVYLGRASTRGLESTRHVMFTICRSLVPVREATLRGLARTS